VNFGAGLNRMPQMQLVFIREPLKVGKQMTIANANRIGTQ